MHKKQSGFVLLFTIITISFISLMCIKFSKIVSMNNDIIFCRETYYKNYYLTDLVFSYAEKLAKEYFDQIIKKKRVVLDLNFIPKKLRIKDTYARCLFIKKDNNLILEVALYKNDSSYVCKIKSFLKKRKNNEVVISHYTICDII